MTGADLYFEVCEDLFESGGLILGIVTQDEFIGILNETLADFLRQTAMISQIQTQSVFAGQGQYPILDSMMRVDNAFVGGVYLEPTSVRELNNNMPRWRTKLDSPRQFHVDELPIKTVELAPVPALSGVYVPGPNEPGPPHAQLDTFSIVDGLGATIAPDAHHDLTLIGPQTPKLVDILDDPICTSDGTLIPDDIVRGYLAYGVLERIFSGENELRNISTADFCHSMYQEGVTILQEFTNEESEDQ